MENSKDDESHPELDFTQTEAGVDTRRGRLSADRGAELQRAWLVCRPLPSAPDGQPDVCIELRLEDLVGAVVRLGPSDDGSPLQGDLGDEIVRFELDGARYALLIRLSVRARRALQAEQAAVNRADYTRQLSQRERQIAELVCAGATVAQASQRLGIREMTARSYLKSIFLKLGVRSTQAMVCRYALALARAQGNARLRPS